MFNPFDKEKHYEVRIIRNSEEVYANEWTLPAPGYVIIERDWPASPASYEVKVRADGVEDGDWATGYIGEDFRGIGCVNAKISANPRTGRISITADTRPDEDLDCPSD